MGPPIDIGDGIGGTVECGDGLAFRPPEIVDDH
jgi:hypothetical protein